MNTNQKKIVRHYITSVKSFFPTFYPKKRKIITDLKQLLNSFYQEHNNFTIDELYNEFGSPQEYAGTIINNTPDEELLKNIRMKKRSVLIIGVLFIIIFAFGVASTTIIVRAISKYTTAHYHEVKLEEDS